jgi:hypothetical protein
MRRIILLIFGIWGLSILILAWLALSSFLPLTPAPCTTPFYTAQLSPDGRWKAVVEEDLCEGSTENEHLSRSHVELLSMLRPAVLVDILSLDTTGHPERRPHISWAGMESLDIAVQRTPTLEVLTRYQDCVTINLRFDAGVPAK